MLVVPDFKAVTLENVVDAILSRGAVIRPENSAMVTDNSEGLELTLTVTVSAPPFMLGA
jgi:hypothetical protein